MTIKPDRMVNYPEVLLTIKSYDILIAMVLKGQVTNINYHICTARVPMATNLGKVVTQHEELPLIKLHYPSIKWFYEVT